MPALPFDRKLSRCVWSEAGVIGYKLCDRNLECDNCEFDVAMKRPSTFRPFDSSGGATIPTPTTVGDDLTRRFLDECFSLVGGKQFMTDRSYSTGHVWIKHGEHGEAVLGADHIVAGLVGAVTGVVLPRENTHLVRGAPCCWILHDQSAISLISPVTGLVLAANGVLREAPELLTQDPYGSGWLLSTRPDDLIETLASRSWNEHQDTTALELLVLRSKLETLAGRRPSIGFTLHDAGSKVDSLIALVGPAAFFDLLAPFLTPP